MGSFLQAMLETASTCACASGMRGAFAGSVRVAADVAIMIGVTACSLLSAMLKGFTTSSSVSVLTAAGAQPLVIGSATSQVVA